MYNTIAGPTSEELQYTIAGISELTVESEIIVTGSALEHWLYDKQFLGDINICKLDTSKSNQRHDSLQKYDDLREILSGKFWALRGDVHIMTLCGTLFALYLVNVEHTEVALLERNPAKGKTTAADALLELLKLEPLVHQGVFLRSDENNTVHEAIKEGIVACQTKTLQFNKLYSTPKKFIIKNKQRLPYAIDYIYQKVTSTIEAGWTWKNKEHEKLFTEILALKEEHSTEERVCITPHFHTNSEDLPWKTGKVQHSYTKIKTKVTEIKTSKQPDNLLKSTYFNSESAEKPQNKIKLSADANDLWGKISEPLDIPEEALMNLKKKEIGGWRWVKKPEAPMEIPPHIDYDDDEDYEDIPPPEDNPLFADMYSAAKKVPIENFVPKKKEQKQG